MNSEKRRETAQKQHQKNRVTDSKILVDISQMALPERRRRVQALKSRIEKAEVALSKKRSVSKRAAKQDRQIIADEDGLIELRRRLNIEEAEYLTMKSITPDYEES